MKTCCESLKFSVFTHYVLNPKELKPKVETEWVLLIPGKGNGEPGTGNRERGTGNGEPGTGVWERVHSGNPYKIQNGGRKHRNRVKCSLLIKVNA